MKTIQVPATEELSTLSQSILAQVQKKMGKVPNLYATIGYSGQALKGMLDFEATLPQDSSFTGKEKEAINLIVSQVNNCDYCLSAHTMLAQLKGFSKEDTLAIRKGIVSDSKLNAIISLAASIANNKGTASEEALEQFFEVGYDEKALIELIGLTTLRTFTNYVYANTKIPVDFPAIESIA
ncbi:carboxymuconolactone decarboxylase family protein [Emticicia sp. ODNR4P]|jgi:uncharacterized peroxidase-related enzyme|nr:carboxymuconolactone decarboxylase family protein [Emticicia sp. ODNR4P]